MNRHAGPSFCWPPSTTTSGWRAAATWSEVPSRYRLEWCGRKEGFILPRTASASSTSLHGGRRVARAPPPRSTATAQNDRIFGRLEEAGGCGSSAKQSTRPRATFAARDRRRPLSRQPATWAADGQPRYIAAVRGRGASRPGRSRRSISRGARRPRRGGDGGDAVALDPTRPARSTRECMRTCRSRRKQRSESVSDPRRRFASGLFDYTTPALVAALYRATADGGFVARPSAAGAVTERWTSVARQSGGGLCQARPTEGTVREVWPTSIITPFVDLVVTRRVARSVEGRVRRSCPEPQRQRLACIPRTAGCAISTCSSRMPRGW